MMTDDPKRVVVKLIEKTDAVISGLNREPMNARRHQRLKDDITRLAAEVRSARGVAIVALGVAVVALLLAL